MTLHEIIDWAVQRFDEADIYFGHGTDNAWDEAVNIARFVLKFPLFADESILEKSLTIDEVQAIEKLVEQRIQKRIPAAYLTHESWFAGLEFYVDERVIVPRSPIAELIEQQFQPWINPDKVKRVLDLCTGSGCIAIACAHYFPEVQVDAVELSPDAFAVAEINVVKHDLCSRVNLLQGDLFAPVGAQKYGIIVSNPPYIKEEAVADFPQEYQHEPEMAFVAGKDGLQIVDIILREAAQYLTDDGILVVEVGSCVGDLEAKYPKLPFIWLEFERGGEGVFLLQKNDLDSVS
ncbi:MAG: 50S ribosomal protein L3 N(5)-glutamine methyltransferase [Gammaproteobacteria bacterium]|nr:50S ribosomal protein L3 N(5)-glutamine methyltransferase [Gammaproteobacteria bacterium]